MARRSRSSRDLTDLSPYAGCGDEALGYAPVAIGWLRSGEHPAGAAPAGFLDRLRPYCQPENTVCRTRAARPCPVCRQVVAPFGAGEIRVIGDEEIYGAPDLIAHYVEAHRYLPPAEFIDAVLRGPAPQTAEHRALRRALGDH